MTVASEVSRVEYAGDGVSVNFPVSFYFLESDDLVVISVTADGTSNTLSLGSDYTVVGAGVLAGGTVTASIAPVNGTTLIIYRDPDELQLTDYQANDPFPAETHERALDKLTMIAQRLKQLIGRSFTLPDSDISGASLVLPTPQPFYVIGWNATATALQNFLINSSDLLSFIQAGVGAVLRTSQNKSRDILSVKDFGAVGDGVTDDSAAIQLALNYAGTNDIALYFPKGAYYHPNTATSLSFSGNLSIYGDGMYESYLKFNDDIGATRNDLIVTSSLVNLSLRNIGFVGSWGDDGTYTERSMLMSGDITGTLLIDSCRFAKSRYFLIGLTKPETATVVNSIFEYSAADGCRITDSRNVNVSNNLFRFVNDDCIALHTKDTAAFPAKSTHIVSGNRIVDSQGIKVLGGKDVVIKGNVIIRPHTQGIIVGSSDLDTTEGQTSVVNVLIDGNIIENIFKGTTFSPSSSGNARPIAIQCPTPTTNGSGYVGQRNGSGGIVQPFAYWYVNNTDAVPPSAGNWFLTITNNIITRTLTTTANYSDYGYGSRYGRSGPVNPAITTADLGLNNSTITITNHQQNAKISHNIIYGSLRDCLFLDGTNATAYTSWIDVEVSHNQFINFGRYGVYTEGPGTIEIKNNLFDGDPLHVNAQRLANGKWNNSTAHAAFGYTETTATLTGNTFRNVCSILNGTTSNDHIWNGNSFYHFPATSNGFNANNIGIGTFASVQKANANTCIEDGDPANATYGKTLNQCANSSTTLPTTGYYTIGHNVENTTATVAGAAASQYIVKSWKRITNGSGHVLNTDWVEVRTLTGT